jgi:hypothetical protein
VTDVMPAEGIFSLIWVIIALPFAGAAILLLFVFLLVRTWFVYVRHLYFPS